MKKSLAGIAVAAAACLVLAGCGSDGDDGADAGATTSAAAGLTTADAQAAVTAATADVPFQGPATSPTPQAGKKIGVIVCAAAASGCTRVADGVKAGGEILGWETKVYDGQGLASAQNTAVQQALSQGMDGIVLVAIPSANISQAMTAARAKNVPVVSVEADNKIGDSGTDVFGEPDSGSIKGGTDLANWVIAETDSKAKVAILSTTEFPSTVNRTKGFKDQLAKCDGCEVVAEQNYLLSSALKDVPLTVQSILQANPDVNYMFVDIGQFGSLAATTIGSGKDVKVVSVDCNPDEIAAIRNGDVQTACAANGLESGGYAALDDLNRAFNDQPQSDELVVPTKLLVKTNLPEGDQWDGDFDPAVAYGKLWGKS